MVPQNRTTRMSSSVMFSKRFQVSCDLSVWIETQGLSSGSWTTGYIFLRAVRFVERFIGPRAYFLVHVGLTRHTEVCITGT